MLKKISLILILLGLAIELAFTAGEARAEGANHINFTGTAYSACANGDPGVDFCGVGDSQVNANGDIVIMGYKDTMIFTSTDERWTGKCLYSADPFILGKSNAWPLMGMAVCTPSNPKYTGGFWQARINQVILNHKSVSMWTAKGYGKLDGLLAITYNTQSKNFRNGPPGPTDVGVIIELPGYVPVQ